MRFFYFWKSGLSLLRSCAPITLLMVLATFAAADNPKPQTNVCGVSDEIAASLRKDTTTHVNAGTDYEDAIASLLHEKQFDQLDCLAQHARLSKDRFSGGGWKLSTLYLGLDDAVPRSTHASEEDWSEHLQLLKAWTSERPQSVTARIALADSYVDYAYFARGDGYANTVSDNGWKLFRERLATAKETLDSASSLPTKDPQWYWVMLQIANYTDWSLADTQALYDQAIKFEPDYYYYAAAFAGYLDPKWHGSPGDRERFVQEAADHIGGTKGDIFYYHVALMVMCGCQDDPQFDWPRVVRGFRANEKQYGVSLSNLNNVAYLAVMQKDAITANELFVRIGDNWEEDQWKDREDFDSSKGWAAMVAGQQHREEEAKANAATPEGIRYTSVFEKKYRKVVESCMKTKADAPGTFETLTSVGAHGTIEDLKIYWYGYDSVCMYQKLSALQKKNAKVFPAPPKAPYWVRLDLNETEFVKTASK